MYSLYSHHDIFVAFNYKAFLHFTISSFFIDAFSFF